MRLSTAKIQNATAQKKTVRLFDGRGVSGDRADRESLVAFQVSLRGQGEADISRRVPRRRIEEGARLARRDA
jgi:hypothetical protein